ncbi:MAG: PspC domain-containing protein [Anaerolineales bacterium]|nr:PspC domain-containing protein [Anaerolineales bacterium]
MPLRRSEHDKVLLGVCGGIGEKLDIDANLIRLIWVAFALGTFGLGALLYGAMGLLLPQESVMTANMPEVAQNITIVDVGAPKAK